ncbi:hypothetical protein D3C81_1646570 [compost metagenome]
MMFIPLFLGMVNNQKLKILRLTLKHCFLKQIIPLVLRHSADMPADNPLGVRGIFLRPRNVAGDAISYNFYLRDTVSTINVCECVRHGQHPRSTMQEVFKIAASLDGICQLHIRWHFYELVRVRMPVRINF